jgi:Fe-S cluster biogenesis protein NfuA
LLFSNDSGDFAWHTGCSDGFPSREQSMISRERVEMVLNRIRPMMQADGGDIELLDVQGNSARVRLTGMCSGCPSAHLTLYMGVEMALKEEISEFEELVVA